MLLEHQLEEILTGLDSAETLQVRKEWLITLSIQAYGIHAEVVEITDLLCHGTHFMLLGSNALNEFCQLVDVVVGQLGEATPTWVHVWLWIVGNPVAGGILGEVIAWTCSSVHVGVVDARRLHTTRWCAGCQCSCGANGAHNK